MASDSTAGGAPAATPDQTPDQMNDDLDIPNKPFRGPGDETATLIADLEKRRLELESEKADLQDKLLRALADSQNARRRAQQDVERERKFGIERFGKDALLEQAQSLDAGFDRDVLAQMMGTLGRFADDEIPLAASELPAAKAFFTAWAKELR